MKIRALALVLLLAAGACEAPRTYDDAAPIACAEGSITAQGSSAQATAISAWIKNYQVNCPKASLVYASTGSGAGLRAFYGGTGDFAGSDSPIAAADVAKATARCASGPALHLPMVIGPIALAFTVAGVDDLRLAPGTIAALFTGKIKNWDDPRIKKDNPGLILPSTPVRTIHRADSSGTTDNFTKFLAATAKADWALPSGSAWPAPGGIAQRGSNRVVAAIESTDGAIGYVEASYARFHNLPTARVGNAAGQFAPLTDEAAARTVAAATITGSGNDLQLQLDYTTKDAAAYPLVLVTYEVVCRAGTPDLVKSFLGYAASPAGQDAATRLGYAPLPNTLRDRVTAAIDSL
ncbi:phosphate ABC transporter substrate-binding protein PstS [Paractinoplanes atraurantiacus]|uniref:Phosphate-binding protein n=1 Tax=Paractinoplanes atraurantiacus TaxID=1036182 RepID=A0A285ILC6_9ACTN|nr:phosphate ABC transporter substrate-binding protein PstS [Actinoplanes atraurantiacus]SNY48567.1 phosphate transport system substrate-binding protein [Actinoplanes atraurantiacus]